MKNNIPTRDEELFRELQNGNEKAFDLLFTRFFPMLCAYSKQYVAIEDGQEIVQDVMVWLWENREMQIIDTSLKHYLFRIVHNRCLTLLKREEVKEKVFSTIHKSLQGRFEDPDLYEVTELRRKIESAINQLPHDFREAFELNRFERLTYNEIATRLNVSPKTVDYRIQQALKLLRKELKDYLPFILFLNF